GRTRCRRRPRAPSRAAATPRRGRSLQRWRGRNACLLLLDRSLLHIIEIREVLGEIGVAFALDFSLVGAAAIGSAFAIAAIERVDDVHPRRDLAGRRKARFIQAGIVREIDEHLAGARIRAGGREDDEASLVALL